MFGLLPLCLCLFAAGSEPAFHNVTCEGHYRKHLQGACIDGREAIFWSFTDVLVKTDRQGRLLKQVPVASHHGDLCYENGKLYVAVNLGKFNEPPGKADSWVYVYDAADLRELARHPVPEVVHGAGGMACHAGRFMVVGGLPADIEENYVYEYDRDFRFVRRHVIASGQTYRGIQTVAYAQGSWWFGCYGTPKILLKTDEEFRLQGRYEFNCSIGIVPLADGAFLVGVGNAEKGEGRTGRLVRARPDPHQGLKLED